MAHSVVTHLRQIEALLHLALIEPESKIQLPIYAVYLLPRPSADEFMVIDLRRPSVFIPAADGH